MFLIKCSGSVLYVYNLCLDDQFRSEVKADVLGLFTSGMFVKKEELGLNYMDMNTYFK